ncbi:hypothetical protein [Chamaesiphon sp. VAR_48_metabat_403]|uniref:hypothetical protein n=1 Tax=Chamaesiphon sp. VAR_48_metabat_403 TaxID=2964700 RepID=UPI00286E67E1|nr:hypothetical protein [Chamaesiphon sp. VAR_48_metabat_403]
MSNYQVLVNPQTFINLNSYLEQLKAGYGAGTYLDNLLKHSDIDLLSTAKFIELLLRTKRPQIFAEFEVYGNGIDWNQTELSLLGDISIAVPVTVYDNGKHRQPDIHDEPFAATLVFTSGALLRNGNNITPVDWAEVTLDGALNSDGYYRLYERRLLPAFSYINESAKSRGKMALITIPGLGCGQFAGIFRGQLGTQLQQALIRFFQTHGRKFANIRAVYYDPYQECENDRTEIEGISLLVRPLTKGNSHKPQLCKPQAYAEAGDNFTDCELFSFVAWDHVSWPGNDFYGGARSTDDGVKAAATNTMMVMTGIEGIYHPHTFQYCPPATYSTWKDAISRHTLQLNVRDNLSILPPPDKAMRARN